MADMPEIRLARTQRVGCVRCGGCCRRWHVALRPAEIESLRSRDWSGESGLPVPADPVTRIAGHPYLAHRANGDCVYLDPATSLCRLEVRFGHQAKPLGCRVYPLNLASVLPGVVSCGVRFDCPAVQQNAGTPLRSQQAAISGFVREMGLAGRIEAFVLEGLEPANAERLAAWFSALVLDPPAASPALMAQTLFGAALHFSHLGPEFLADTATMKEILPPLRDKFRGNARLRFATAGATTLRRLDRALFRLWLAGYLRRDEEVVGKPFFRRIRRTVELARLFAGRGTYRQLGAEHPDVSVDQAALFQPWTVAPAEGDAVVWDPVRRWLAARLETLQFFGPSCNHRGFFDGLQALAQAMLLMLAVARLRAAAAGRRGGPVTAADAEYATGAIDHSFGRSRLLATAHQTALERWFRAPGAFTILAHSLGGNSKFEI